MISSLRKYPDAIGLHGDIVKFAMGVEATILIEPESVDSMAEGMRRVLTDTVLRLSLIEKSRARYSEFTWQQCAKKTVISIEHAFEMRSANSQKMT